MTGLSRRHFVAGAAAAAASANALGQVRTIVQPFGNGERPLVQLPGKRPMIGLTVRPPQLETPFAVFNQGLLTPNDAFFVRYHLWGLPSAIDPMTFQLAVGGHVDAPLSLSLAELKRDFPVQEVIAVNQCSGNSRGFLDPRVGGGQLGNGAMGNARWRGVPLKALLDKAGVRAGARQVTFNGLDNPPVKTIPDFVKALDLDHARDGEVLVAFAMNGADLPFLNGYPLRLVVPGYYGTYWVKHLSEIDVVDAEFDGYWMTSAYRVPDNDCNCVAPGTRPDKTRPIGKLNVRSFVTSHHDGEKLARGTAQLRGIAFSGGEGIARVLVSPDGGASWQEASLGEDLGRYSFREWKLALPLGPGKHAIKVRAYAPDGSTQPLDPLWQPSGYMRNVVETLNLEVA